MLGRFKISILVVLLAYSQTCESSRILIIAPFPAASHVAVIQSVSLELANRGHDITIITTQMIKDPPNNYHQIQMGENPEYKNIDIHVEFEKSAQNAFQQMLYIWYKSLLSIENIFKTESIKNFIENDNSHFDLVISEIFYQEALYLLAHKYNAPLVLIGTTTMYFHVANFMGNPPPLSYALHDCYRYDDGESVIGKLYNAVLTKFDQIGRKYYYLPNMNRVAQKYYKRLRAPIPSVEDMERNVSLVLFNTHFTYDQVLPTIPGIVNVGGIYMKTNNTLPDDIRTFIDESKDGVIYFALGSHLYSNKMRREHIESFVQVFKELKQRIIWKWEDDEPPELKNALFRKWLPQYDILGHPNVKLFISHGGMLGSQEAIHHGVPILGMPIFTDQHTNIAKLAKRKVAEKLIYATMNENTIREAIHKILHDPDYKNNMEKLSKAYRDRLNHPKDEAMYWIEYVIRHGGLYPKSPMAFMSFWDYYVIEICLFAFVLFNLTLVCCFCKCARKLCQKHKTEIKFKKS